MDNAILFEVVCIAETRWGRNGRRDKEVPGPKKNETCTVIDAQTAPSGGVYYKIKGYEQEGYYNSVWFDKLLPMHIDCRKEIAESQQKTDEVPDKIFVPQTVNN